MITENDQLKIANACYAMVLGRFADMLNPDMRGPNFSWARFPDLMADTCATELCLYIDFQDWPKTTVQEFQDTARQYGREISERIVQRAKVLDF